MDDEGNNAVHVAAANGYDPIRISLADNDINCRNSFGWTPLMYSVYYGHGFLVNKFLSLGADFKLRNDFGASIITLAAASEKIDVIRSILKIDTKTDVDFNYASPLAIAIVLGNLTVTRYLIDHGFEPNSTMPASGVTPLMLAVSQNNVEIVKLLVERDVCISKVNIAGYSAFDIAMMRGSNEILSILHKRTGQYLDLGMEDSHTSDEEISLAAKSGNLLSLQNHLSKKYLSGRLKISHFENFTKNIAPIDKKYISPQPQLPYFMLGDKSNLKCTSISSLPGCNNIPLKTNTYKAFEGISSSNDFHVCSKNRDEDDIEKVNKALMAACLGGHFEAVHLLLEAGANPNCELDGRTPLMIATTVSHMEIIKLLLSVGADPLVSSSRDNLTAFDLATVSGASIELIRFLACLTMQPSVVDANDIQNLGNTSELDCISSPFGKMKRFKFTRSPQATSYLKSKKIHQNQCNEKESGKVISPYRSKHLGNNELNGSSNLRSHLIHNEKNHLNYDSDNKMRLRRPSQSEIDLSQLQLPFLNDTTFKILPSDNILSLKFPDFIPARELTRVVQKVSFNEMRGTPTKTLDLKTTDIPVKILNLI